MSPTAAAVELFPVVAVALVDTEGETAIDVFYLTRNGNRLSAAEKKALRTALTAAIEENAR